MRDIIESIKDCLVRFFDSLFTKQARREDEINFLRMEIAKQHNELSKFFEFLTTKPEEPEETVVNHPPIRTSNYVPWNVRRQQLEKESRDRAASMKVSKIEDIEDLEKTLGVEQNVDAVSK